MIFGIYWPPFGIKNNNKTSVIPRVDLGRVVSTETLFLRWENREIVLDKPLTQEKMQKEMVAFDSNINKITRKQKWKKQHAIIENLEK